MASIKSVLWMMFFLLAFTPVAAIYRRMRADPLRLARDPALKSYWRDREGRSFRPMSSPY